MQGGAGAMHVCMLGHPGDRGVLYKKITKEINERENRMHFQKQNKKKRNKLVMKYECKYLD